MSSRRPRCRTVAFEVAAVAIVATLCFPESVGAHSPHDVVTRVAVQQLQYGTPILYAIVRGIAVSTHDLGRTWSRLSAGIWRHRLEDIAVGGDGTIAVTDGHTVLVRRSGKSHWESSEITDQESDHVRLAARSSGIFAHAGQTLYELGPSGSIVSDGVALLDASGVLADHDGNVATVDGRSLGTTVRSPSSVCATDFGVFSSKGATIYHGVEPIHTADAEVTGLCAVGQTIVATLARDHCIASTDGGVSWKRCAGLTTDPQADEEGFNKPHFSAVNSFMSGAQRHFVIGGFDGLFLSTDAIDWRESHGTLPRHLVSALDATAGELNVTTYGAGLSVVDQGIETSTISPPSKRLFSTAKGPDGVHIITHASGAIRSEDDGRTWKPVTIGPASGSAGLKQRAKGVAKQAAIEVGGRLGTNSLERLRSLYKTSLASKPQHEKLPFFGSVVIPPHADADPWLLVAKPSGVLRSHDGGRSFLRWLKLAPGETLGLARTAGETMVLTPTSIFVSVDGETWNEHERPEGGALDSIAVWGQHFAIGTPGGLFTSEDRGATWQRVRPAPVAALTTGKNQSLLVQFDDGMIERCGDGGGHIELAPAGTPILRHCVSFPDMAPMMLETQSAVVGSDHYTIFSITDTGVEHVSRCSMLHADRHELDLHGSWKVLPAKEACGGVRATSQGTGRIDVWVPGPSVTVRISLDSPPPARAQVNGVDVAISAVGGSDFEVNIPKHIGEQLLSIDVPHGFSFEGVELRHPETAFRQAE